MRRLRRRELLAVAGALVLSGCGGSSAQHAPPAGGEYPGYTPDTFTGQRMLLGIGHSYMAGAGASAPAKGLLPLTAAAIGYAFTNAGIGSTDVDSDGVQAPGSSGLARVQQVVAQARPDVALVVYGANAVGGATTPKGLAITPELYQADYGRFLNLMRQGMQGPIFCSGVPALPLPRFSEELLAPWNAAIRAATESVARVTFIDTTGWFNSGNFATLIGPDDTHPTDAGYAFLAQRYAAAMRPLLPR